VLSHAIVESDLSAVPEWRMSKVVTKACGLDQAEIWFSTKPARPARRLTRGAQRKMKEAALEKQAEQIDRIIDEM